MCVNVTAQLFHALGLMRFNSTAYTDPSFIEAKNMIYNFLEVLEVRRIAYAYLEVMGAIRTA